MEISVQGVTLRGQRWNRGAGQRAIALHGWLDNCASFAPMAGQMSAQLAGVDLVAFDGAGCGQSDFRSADSQYLIWFDVGDIIGIADQLGWHQFSLLGHSRGAAVCALCAGSFPERIAKLLLIDGLIPRPREESAAPANLSAQILDTQRLVNSTGTAFASREQAIDSRTRGVTQVAHRTAATLARRGLRENADGTYTWRIDQRQKAASSLYLSPAQIAAFLQAIQSPTLFIEGERGIFNDYPQMRDYLQHIGNLTHQILPGGHHLHMEESAADCARAVGEFLCAKV
ncbi:MAG: alpha/beta hydrolase [Cellvibrionales bacterium]|nr:alpha/beta hydrolase [Cellvibrionales bacterium]